MRGIGLLALCLLLAGAADALAAGRNERERRCLAMIAYAEAAAGMLAVMKVVHNRIAHPSFADDACAVTLEPGQFQPVAERPALRRALAQPEAGSLVEALGATSRTARLRLVEAWRLAGAVAIWPARDPTRGALYFVNPRLMDPAKCPWFAGLKRTAIIGEHVFMTHYAGGEWRGRPALDCAVAGRGYARVATRAATPTMIRAWHRTATGRAEAFLQARPVRSVKFRLSVWSAPVGWAWPRSGLRRRRPRPCPACAPRPWRDRSPGPSRRAHDR